MLVVGQQSNKSQRFLMAPSDVKMPWPASSQLIQLIWGFMASQALHAAAKLTGRERTEAEFEESYERAGFKLTRVVPAIRLSIVEGVAA